MKKVLLAITIFFISNFSMAQLTENRWHFYGKYSFGNLGKANYHNAGIAAEWMVFEKLGLNYNLEYLHRSDNFSHIHGSIGSVGGPIFIGLGAFSMGNRPNDPNSGHITNSQILNDFGSTATLIGLAILLMPDGISYHFPIQEKYDIAPYINFLGFDWVYHRNAIDIGDIFYGTSLGVRGTLITKDNITFNTFVETRKVAGNGWGAGIGFGVGYTFNKKEVKD